MKVRMGSTRIFIRPGKTDLRKGVSGLSALVTEEMKEDVFSDSVFLFCNRDRTLLKCLRWDKTGFWLAQKRLEKEKWPWPLSSEAVRNINGQQLELLLSGIDFWKAHKELEYSATA